MNSPPIRTIKQIAAFLGVDRRTFKNWHKQHPCPYEYEIGGTATISKEKLLDWYYTKIVSKTPPCNSGN